MVVVVAWNKYSMRSHAEHGNEIIVVTPPNCRRFRDAAMYTLTGHNHPLYIAVGQRVQCGVHGSLTKGMLFPFAHICQVNDFVDFLTYYKLNTNLVIITNLYLG